MIEKIEFCRKYEFLINLLLLCLLIFVSFILVFSRHDLEDRVEVIEQKLENVVILENAND